MLALPPEVIAWQISVLTEHMMSLSQQLSDKHDELSALRRGGTTGTPSKPPPPVSDLLGLFKARK